MQKPQISGVLEADSLFDIIQSKNKTLISRTLAIAVLERNFAAMKILFQNGASLTSVIDDHNSTALDAVVSADDPDVTDFVLPYCDEPTKVLWQEKVRILTTKMLSAEGEDSLASINIPNAEGYYQIHVAVIMGNTPVVEALLFAKANVNVCNASGDMPLHLACTKGDLPIVRLLVGANASLTATGSEKLTPAELARKYSHAKLLTLLEPQPVLSNNAQASFAPSVQPKSPVARAAPAAPAPASKTKKSNVKQRDGDEQKEKKCCVM